jgi:1-acyl-sn-glycerol-3-phosphate acyltransferase
MIGQAEPARFPEKRTTALDAAGGPQGAAPRHSTHGARNTKGNWSGSLRMPRWAARFPAHHIRRAIEETIIVRLVHTYARPEVEGRHHIERVQPPLLIVSNHRSHVDAALIKTCVPRAIRGRLAPGMTTRWERLFFGEETGTFKRYIGEWIESRMIQLLFHAWPIPRTAGFRQSLMYAGELADSGFSILLFPEGRHVPAAVMGPFRPGSGILARELRLPVVPVYLEGSDQIIREGEPWYRFHHGRARVVFGTPFEVDPEVSTEDAAHQLQTAIMALAPETLRVDPDLPPEESLDRCEEPSTCRP